MNQPGTSSRLQVSECNRRAQSPLPRTRLPLCYHSPVRHGANGGRFITFEGLDGCGKSTHLEKLAGFLREQGFEVLTTREPGGTEIGERVRGILLDSRTRGLAPLAELALMFASRAQQISEVDLAGHQSRRLGAVRSLHGFLRGLPGRRQTAWRRCRAHPASRHLPGPPTGAHPAAGQ